MNEKKCINNSILKVSLIFAIWLFFCSSSVFGYKGDVVGEAVDTDILVHINQFSINSFNYNGYTYVIAEDLSNFGFDVVWDEAERKLLINRNSDKKLTGIESKPILESKLNAQIGRKVFDIYDTDIKTFVNGQEVAGYNIGGATVICMEDLACFGELKWQEMSKDLRLLMPNSDTQEENPIFIEMSPEICDTAIQYTKDHAEGLLTERYGNTNEDKIIFNSYGHAALNDMNISAEYARTINDAQIEVCTIIKHQFEKNDKIDYYYDGYTYIYLLLNKCNNGWTVVAYALDYPPLDWNSVVLKDVVQEQLAPPYKEITSVIMTYFDYVTPNDFYATVVVNAVDVNNIKCKFTQRMHFIRNDSGEVGVAGARRLNTIQIINYDDIPIENRGFLYYTPPQMTFQEYKILSETRRLLLIKYFHNNGRDDQGYRYACYDIYKDSDGIWKIANEDRYCRYWNELPYARGNDLPNGTEIKSYHSPISDACCDYLRGGHKKQFVSASAKPFWVDQDILKAALLDQNQVQVIFIYRKTKYANENGEFNECIEECYVTAEVVLQETSIGWTVISFNEKDEKPSFRKVQQGS